MTFFFELVNNHQYVRICYKGKIQNLFKLTKTWTPIINDIPNYIPLILVKTQHFCVLYCKVDQFQKIREINLCHLCQRLDQLTKGLCFNATLLIFGPLWLVVTVGGRGCYNSPWVYNLLCLNFECVCGDLTSFFPWRTCLEEMIGPLDRMIHLWHELVEKSADIQILNQTFFYMTKNWFQSLR